ncbi:unnamed protein product, partial [marine sediment metagenome]
MLPQCNIVDSHHHIGKKRTSFGEWEFTGAQLVRQMDKNRIQKAIVVYFVSELHVMEDFVNANNYVAEAVQEFPDRLVGTVVVNPLMRETALQEIERCHHLGFRAIKLHPIFHGHYHLDGTGDSIARLASDLELPILIHSDFTSSVCSPYQITRFARRFPNTTFLLLHFGLYPELCKYVPDIVKGVDNILLDTSQTPDLPYEVYVRPVKLLGSSRLLFGSDGPECDVTVNLRKIEVAM